MNKATSIPIYSLDAITDKELLITKFTNIGKNEIPVKAAHRDDYYIFIFQEKGDSHIMVDFKEIAIKDRCVLSILPGQVHYGMSAHDTLAWFIALDTALVSEIFRPVIERSAMIREALPIGIREAGELKKCISLLSNMGKRPRKGNFIHQITRSLSDAFIGILALAYCQREQSTDASSSRAVLITREFKNLVFRHFKTMKSPTAYATALNISGPYLNETVKLTTGFPVSHWIQQEIILEAKRMLYYTNNSVKEIAYALGYADYAYFSRLFSKVEGLSPLAFRLEYRK